MLHSSYKTKIRHKNQADSNTIHAEHFYYGVHKSAAIVTAMLQLCEGVELLQVSMLNSVAAWEKGGFCCRLYYALLTLLRVALTAKIPSAILLLLGGTTLKTAKKHSKGGTGFYGKRLAALARRVQ